MAKRFTDTDKYKKPFLRTLQGAYKLLWDYICSDCNHAGIWIVDFEIAQIYLGKDMPVNRKDALKFFNADKERVIEIDDGARWFIASFIEFQYGDLNPQNRVHASVIQQLKSYDLWNEAQKTTKGLVRPLRDPKDRENERDKDKKQKQEAPPELTTEETHKRIGEMTDKIKRQGEPYALSVREAVSSISSIPPGDVWRYLDRFAAIQKAKESPPKNLIEYKSHFINWLNIQLREEKKEQPKFSGNGQAKHNGGPIPARGDYTSTI